MTTPNIILKSITINEPRQLSEDITEHQTATLLFSVSFGGSVGCLELSVTVVHQEKQVDHTVASALRILHRKFQALCEILDDQLGESGHS